MSEPAEGWYADPTGAAQLRWWDGHAWTQYVEPYEATPAQSETAEATPAQSETAEATPAYDEAPYYAQQEQVAANVPTQEAAEVAPIPSPEEPSYWEDSVPAPSPEETSAWEATPASSMDEAGAAPIPMPDESEPSQETPKRSGTLKWTLGCVASWALVAVFIAVLVLAWSYLGASGRIHDDAKSRAETAQQELDTAQSTLADINRQIEEANK
ncbi:DUF2510 domain-containing protein [Pauljensenia sp. 27098_8_83]